ncbi:MAG: MFS transporter [Candidatus Latescibacterota bacterium]|jgi:sugar phosphate permease
MPSISTKPPRLFFGWYIALAAYVIHVLNGGLLFHAFSAYILPLQAEFGWSRAAVSGIFSMVRAESGILGPLQGWLIDRYGPRSIMRVGIFLFGLGYLAFSRIESLSQFYLAFALIALGSSLGGFISISTTITNWFVRQRSTVLGLTMTGMGVGGLLVPIIVWCLTDYGWRDTAFYSGLLIWLIGLPCTQLMRQRPEQYGLRPPTFWFLSAGHSAALFVVGTVLVHQIPHMIEHVGLTPEQAVANVTVLVACSIIGQLSGGWIGDRVDKRWTMIACMWMHAIALVLFRLCRLALRHDTFRRAARHSLGRARHDHQRHPRRLFWPRCFCHHLGLCLVGHYGRHDDGAALCGLSARRFRQLPARLCDLGGVFGVGLYFSVAGAQTAGAWHRRETDTCRIG